MDATAEALSRAGGISVRLCFDEKPVWDGVDVVHGLGLQDAHIREARRRRVPVCLSVIYWSKAYRTGLLSAKSPWTTALTRARIATAMSLAAARGRHVAKSEAIARFTIESKTLFESADMLLPNSRMEAQAIVRDLGVTTPMRVVPNAVDPARFPPGLPWKERQGVLYVGRLEPHKNQLGLIRALRGTGIPLTIVGGEHPHHPSYAAAVRAEARGAVRVVGQTSHDELKDFYARARVHAVPSGFETTGLVSLEAALAGCNVVTTEVGYAREYFEDMAWYCSPHDQASIRAAVTAALAGPPRNGLRQRILDRYTWEHTAAATVAAYRELVGAEPISMP
jgi:glycosyltransferase involved in cell wall biosynthesis